MNRVLSLHLPTWPTDRLCRELGSNAPSRNAPLVLVGMEGRKRVILAMNAAAKAEGLTIGMDATKARALCADLDMRDFDADADRAALDKLALWAYRHVSPIVAADPPNGIVIDTTGADHLFGGEQATASWIASRLAAIGIASRIAIADTWGAAHALARYNRLALTIVPPGQSASAIDGLPIEALRVGRSVSAGLYQLGFERIGEIERQPRAPFALRFGPELGRQLDQAYGRTEELIVAVRPPDAVEAVRVFAEPIGAAETIGRCIDALCETLCAEMEQRGLGALRLTLIFHRVDSRTAMICIGMAKPVRDARQFTRMLWDKIGTIDPGFGIEKMELAAPQFQSMEIKQASSLIEDSTPDTSGLFDILANRFGASRFHKTVPLPSDVPERSVKRVSLSEAVAGEGWQTLWRRPFQLLRAPEPIQTVALLPDHPPVNFIWRGNRHRVRSADGPERIRGEWWKTDAERGAVRDYFHVENDDGETFWIFRAGDGERAETGSQRWFMHGLFA